MYFPDNTEVRRVANAVLRHVAPCGHAKIRENRKAPRPAYDVVHRAIGAVRGRVVFTVLL